MRRPGSRAIIKRWKSWETNTRDRRPSMAPELVPASARMLILGGGVLVGRTLELLLRSADYSVRYLGEPCLGKPGLGEGELPHGVRLLILAPEASARCREAALALAGSRFTEARIKILELCTDHQEVQVGSRRFLPWPCRIEYLKRQVMDTLLDGSGESKYGFDTQTPQKAKEIVDGKSLD